MMVSVVVPTKNSDEFLEKCLINLRMQTYLNMEIIVVDNFSKDKTIEIAEKYADAVYQVGPERMHQANYGVEKATGEIIYLTGSDMTRDIDFIAQGVKKIKDNLIYVDGYDAIYNSVKTHDRVQHFWGKVKKLERETYIGTFIESARFFKKSAWQELGGFNEEIISLEEDFQHRLDSEYYQTGRIDAREYHLHEDKTLREVFKKAIYYGSYMKKYLKKHKSRGYKQLNPMRPNLSMFLKHPILLVGFIIYKLVQYTGGFYGLKR